MLPLQPLRLAARLAFALRLALLAVSLLVAASACRALADGQPDPAAASAPKPITQDELVKKRAQAAKQIVDLNRQKAALADKSSAAEGGKLGEAVKRGEAVHTEAIGQSQAITRLDEEIELLEGLDVVYVQHLAALDEQREIEQATRRLSEERTSLQKLGPAEPKPYSYLLWDEIRDQLDTERSRSQAIQADSAGDQLLQTAREGFERAERDRRQMTESAEEHHASLSARDLRVAKLRSSLAEAAVNLRRAEVDLKTAKLGRSKLNCDYLQEKSDLVGKQCKFTRHDHESRLAAMDKFEAELHAKLHETERLLQQHERDQSATVGRLRKEGANQNVLDAAIDACQLVRQGRHEELTLLNQRLGEFTHYKHVLSCRYDFFNHALQPNELAQCRTEVQAILGRQQTLQHSCIQRIDEIQNLQSALILRLHAIDENSPLRPWLAMQQNELESLTRLFESSLVQLRTGERSLSRFLGDIAPDAAESGRERLEAAWKLVMAAWNYRLEVVENKPVTIAKLVGGLLYFIIGLFLARVISRVLGRRVLTRFGLNEGARNAIQSIAYYMLCLLCSLVALDLVNLPFAAFTFLGGAVAIGIGFGSQNILNNFISGLILLAEQPLRVGDCVSIDGAEGTVEHIGARSTRVRTMANHEIMVPNSKLLEDKVTNLTLTDNLVQTSIGVTVSPNLGVKEVRRRLLAAATRHPRVLNDPKPIVLFLSFSTTEMAFELRFWVRLNSLQECRLTESDVREAISVMLSDANPATTATKGAIAPPTPTPTSAPPDAAPDAATGQLDPKRAIAAAVALLPMASRAVSGVPQAATPQRKAG